MSVAHSLASWAAHITDAPAPTAGSAEALPNPKTGQPAETPTPDAATLDPDAFSDCSDLTDLGGLSDVGCNGVEAEARSGDEPSPSPLLEFAAPGTPGTTPGLDGEPEVKPPADEREPLEAKEQSPAPTESSSAEPQNARRVLELMERQARELDAPIFTKSCVAGGVRPEEPPLPAEEQRLSSLVSLLCSGGIKDPKPWESTRNLRALFGGQITLPKLLDATHAQLVTQPKLSKGGMEDKNAGYLKAMAEHLRDHHDGRAPPPEEGVLRKIKGIGAGKAQLYIEKIGTPSAMRVSDHVNTISHRLGWHGPAQPLEPAPVEETRALLEAWVPRARWSAFSDALAGFGQKVCGQKPDCARCDVGRAGLCPSAGRVVPRKRPAKRARAEGEAPSPGAKAEAPQRDWEPRGGPGLDPEERGESKPKVEVEYEGRPSLEGIGAAEPVAAGEAEGDAELEEGARVAERGGEEGQRRSGRKKARVSYAGLDAGEREFSW